MNPWLSPRVLSTLYLAEVERLDLVLEELKYMNRVDSLTMVITTMLVPLVRPMSVRIESPWIEDFELLLPSTIANYLGVDQRVTLSKIMNRIAEKSSVTLVTRSSKSDTIRETSLGRKLLLSNLENVRVEIDECIHTKKVELDNILVVILTANLTEKELIKLRTHGNVATIFHK